MTTLDQQQIRLRCLELATGNNNSFSNSSKHALDLANEYYDFIVNGIKK